MLRRTPRFTLFPTRRSSDLEVDGSKAEHLPTIGLESPPERDVAERVDESGERVGDSRLAPVEKAGPSIAHEDVGLVELLRSEEHTSELQSLRQLVCRLLLEK